MGGKSGKIKGASGEREAIKWLCDKFGLSDLYRNLEQTRCGGADCLSIEGYAIEIKRQETLSIPAWWQQTVRQAKNTGRFPVLMYRQNRKRWSFCLPASLITPHSWGYITLTDIEFIHWFTLRIGNEHVTSTKQESDSEQAE